MSSFLDTVITLAQLAYPVLAMVHLQWITCDELLAMATGKIINASCCMSTHWKAYEYLRITVRTV